MLLNPRLQQNTVRVLTAAVAGPALVFAGLRYPGGWKGKAFLMLTGGALIYVNYNLFSRDVRKLLSGGGET